MKNKLIMPVIAAVVAIAAVGGYYIYQKNKAPVQNQTSQQQNQNQNEQSGETTNNNTAPNAPTVLDDLISVTSPLPGETVTSPLTVSGQARGSWYFEAVFPIKLVDANGKVLAQTQGRAIGDWATSNYVPFTATLNFAKPSTATGTLILANDNPSGDPTKAKELEIPVNFGTASAASQNVKLYYYDPNNDKDSSGNILCSSKGLVAVNRSIPKTTTPIQDTIKLLIQGQLTASEKAQGITTEFPLPGVTLTGANLKNGVLTLAFADPQNKTSGGSCRAAVLWDQIQATAKQFSGVSTVKFTPDTLFQP